MTGPFTDNYWRDFLIYHFGIGCVVPMEIALIWHSYIMFVFAALIAGGAFVGGVLNYLIDKDFYNE